MGFRTKQYGGFVPPVAGNVRVEKCFQITPANPTADFWIRASEDDPVIMKIIPWVVTSMAAGSLLVGISTNDDEYIAAGDVNEASVGAATEKKFRLTADTQVLIAFAEVTYATGVLTFTGVAVNNDTVVLGSKTYTFKDTLTGAANEVLVELTASDAIDNLIAAITAGAGAGTKYGTGTTANTSATAAAGAGDTMDVTALLPNDNSIVSTETLTNGSWGATTLTGATALTGQIDLYIEA